MMEKDLKVYVAPTSEVLEVEQEGFLCASGEGYIVPFQHPGIE
jgi:hypothetical protein